MSSARDGQYGLPADLDDRLRREVQASPCPFTHLCSYVGSVVGAGELGLGAAELAEFCSASVLHQSHAFLLGLDLPSPDLGAIARAVREVLLPLMDDPPSDEWSDPAWRFRIRGNDFFVLVLACYRDERHPRGSAVLPIIAVQPEAMFTRAGMTTNSRRRRFTEAARLAFDGAGRDFESLHVAGVPKSLRVLLGEDRQPVRWWSDDVR